jgi:hypothetical protein
MDIEELLVEEEHLGVGFNICVEVGGTHHGVMEVFLEVQGVVVALGAVALPSSSEILLERDDVVVDGYRVSTEFLGERRLKSLDLEVLNEV